MKNSTIALTLAVFGASALLAQAQNAGPGGAPPAGGAPAAAPGGPGGGLGGRGGGRGGRGGPPPISTDSPGFPGVAMLDPAVGRKAKWPVRDADNSPPAGYTARAPKDNGFYQKDADGNNLPGTDLYIWAPSGHFTNYDQSDIPPYTLPDPLVMQDGRRVTTPEMWYKERRPELISLFKDNIYGRVPDDKLPKMKWEVKENEKSDDGKSITKVIIGYFEDVTNPDQPAHADPNGRGGGGGFGGGRGGRGGGRGAPGGAGGGGPGGPGAVPNPVPAVPGGPGATGNLIPFSDMEILTAAGAPAAPAGGAAPGAPGGRGGRGGGRGRGGGGNTITITLTLPNTGKPVPVFFGGPVNDAAGHGWGTGSISGNGGMVARITPPEGQEKPGNFPGQYAITGWTYSRAMDYLVTDKDVDGGHITIAGASTGGKQVLYTAAMDDRIWCVVPESSGAMGVKLNRRDIGETVDNLATGQFAANYCPNFAKYVGHWNDMPTDQHEMIALMAPRKMFITGGNQELWEDVKGGFDAAVAAEPVYNLLGKKGVAAADLPPIEQPIVFGEIGFYQHNGGHMYTANERIWVTAWMEKYLNSPAK